jgi:hypothetical protein
MPIELVPTPVPSVAAAVSQAVRWAGIEQEPMHPGYASAWRRAGLEAAARRHRTSAGARPYGAAPSPRKARGAIRA